MLWHLSKTKLCFFDGLISFMYLFTWQILGILLLAQAVDRAPLELVHICPSETLSVVEYFSEPG